MNYIPLILLAILLIATAKMLISRFKRSRHRKMIIGNGTLVEAHVIGVAPGNISDNNSTWAKLKLSYIHPYTNEQIIAYRSLHTGEFNDGRIYKIALPTLSRITKTTKTSWKYNQTLFASYRQNVDARNISPEEKKQLLNEAKSAMSHQYEQPPKDGEGYCILNPPVPAEGYMSGEAIEFLQTTDTPILHDWTQGLR